MKIVQTKSPMVLVIHTNKNNKLEYRLCEDMNTANLLFPKDQKQTIQCYHVYNDNEFHIGDYVKIINPNYSTFGRVGKIISIKESDYIVSFHAPITSDMLHYDGTFSEEDLKRDCFKNYFTT